MSGVFGRRDLCALDDIPEDDARGFTLREGQRMAKVVVVRWKGEVLAYLNRCPHAGTPLDWTPDHFFNGARTHLMCQTHAALFQVEDGFCTDGPCAGDSLLALPVALEGGRVVVDVDG